MEWATKEEMNKIKKFVADHARICDWCEKPYLPGYDGDQESHASCAASAVYCDEEANARGRN